RLVMARETGQGSVGARLRALSPGAALPWLALAGSSLVTLAVYGRALGFSYFFDDAYDLTRTESFGYWQILAHPFPGYAYYRPLSFIIWKALYQLTGRYDPVLLHLLPLAAHAVAGWLLFLLLRRLTGSNWSLLPALLFLTYPFSFQAVEILGTLMHTLVTAELLAMLVLWYDGRTRASWLHLALASLLAAAALWTHEYGALAAPLLLALEGLLLFQRRIRRPSLWLLVPLVFEALYLQLWFTMDKPGSGNFTHADVGSNAAIWLQNVAYPCSRQVAWISDQLGGDPLTLVFVLSLAGMALAIVAYQLGGRRWLPLLALAAGAAAFAPSAVSLTYEYVQNGPRLFYVVAPASAAFWGFLPALRFKRPALTLGWRVATLALLAVVVAQSVLFIQRRTVMLAYGTQMAQGIIREGARHDGGSLLILNVPAWFAPKTQEYPRGHLGVQLEPGYTGLDRLVYAGSGARTTVDSGALDPQINSWHYNFQPHGEPLSVEAIDARLRAGEPLAVAELEPDRIAVREPGSLTAGQPAPAEHQAAFSGLWLVSASTTRDGDHLTVVSRWYVAGSIPGDPRLRVELRDPGGKLLAERSGYALDGCSPPRLWRPGDLIEDREVFALPGTRGPIAARMGLVDTSGALLPGRDTAGQPLPGDWVALNGTR
ncbi:MAG TPA: hypothetical protein VFI42_02270, partial [Thermomicrobiaceae bacterium]|nr:hypothetical protein [Thermomicrobiaceae bacterium]